MVSEHGNEMSWFARSVGLINEEASVVAVNVCATDSAVAKLLASATTGSDRQACGYIGSMPMLAKRRNTID